MNTRYIATPVAAILLLATPLAAQRNPSTDADRIGSVAAEPTGPTQPYSSTQSSVPLNLRGGAVPTGLHGFYDYQSNGGSPEYISVRPGAWNSIYTTFMNALDGSTVPAAVASRRVGYAVSSDGGANWLSIRSIADVRLGYPDIEVSGEPVPFIATHGDIGGGNQIFVYATPDPLQLDGFFAIGGLPVSTASGRADRGVIWPSFELSADGMTGYVAGSYFSDPTLGFPSSPMQVTSINLGTGQTAERWTEIPDSLHSTTSGGRYVLARSAGGKLGVAYYHLPLFDGDPETGIYYSESTDDGVTWSAPQGVLVGELIVSGLNINGDDDTLIAGINIDGTYIGEDFTLAFNGSMNAVLQFQNMVYWSQANGLKIITLAHQVPGLGAYGLALALRQGNMGTIAYPTLAVSEDGQKIVVAFTAVDQRIDPVTTEIVQVANEAGFNYYRLWAIGSPDGGQTWGDPFIVQDIYGDGTDSASIEYPAAAPVARMVGNDLELNLVFQAKRQPGQFAFTNADQTPGAIEDVYQYYQRFLVTPAMFVAAPVGVNEPHAASGLGIRQVSPNPASHRASINYTVDRSGKVSMRLVDNLGRTVMTLPTDGVRNAGVHTQSLDLDGVASGIYRIVLEQGGSMTSSTLVVR